MPAFVPTFVGESLEENQDIPGSVPVSDHTESPLPGSPGDDGVFTDQHMDAPGFVGSVPQQEGSFYQTDPAPGMSFAGREESAASGCNPLLCLHQVLWPERAGDYCQRETCRRRYGGYVQSLSLRNANHDQRCHVYRRGQRRFRDRERYFPGGHLCIRP